MGSGNVIVERLGRLGFLNIFFRWRYWPMEILYFPLTAYVFLVGSVRAGRLFYFSAANPGISMGGFAGDSKFEIIKKIPSPFCPKTFLVLKRDNFLGVLRKLQHSGIAFPLIVKPDIGEGGFLVKKITSFSEFSNYHHGHTMDYIVQEFVSEPVELSVLIHNAHGALEISSITERKYLVLKGDGVSTVRQLLAVNEKTRFRQKNIKRMLCGKLDLVIGKDSIMQLSCIGNWDYGATYTDRTEIVNKYLLKVFTGINSEVGLFNYARIDLKCASVEDFLRGKFRILEINGVKGEPIHIYDQKTSLLKAYSEIFRHWEYIMTISKRNIRNGAACPGLREGTRILLNHRKIKQYALQPRKQ